MHVMFYNVSEKNDAIKRVKIPLHSLCNEVEKEPEQHNVRAFSTILQLSVHGHQPWYIYLHMGENKRCRAAHLFKNALGANIMAGSPRKLHGEFKSAFAS